MRWKTATALVGCMASTSVAQLVFDHAEGDVEIFLDVRSFSDCIPDEPSYDSFSCGSSPCTQNAYVHNASGVCVDGDVVEATAQVAACAVSPVRMTVDLQIDARALDGDSGDGSTYAAAHAYEVDAAADLDYRRTAWYWVEYDMGVSAHALASGEVNLNISKPDGGIAVTVEENELDSDAVSGAIQPNGGNYGFVRLAASGDVSATSRAQDGPVEVDIGGYASATIAVVECFADWNGDHAVNTLDILAFYGDYASNEDDCDLDGDGDVDTDDADIFDDAYDDGACTEPVQVSCGGSGVGL